MWSAPLELRMGGMTYTVCSICGLYLFGAQRTGICHYCRSIKEKDQSIRDRLKVQQARCDESHIGPFYDWLGGSYCRNCTNPISKFPI